MLDIVFCVDYLALLLFAIFKFVALNIIQVFHLFVEPIYTTAFACGDIFFGSPPKFDRFNSVTLKMTESELKSVQLHHLNLYGHGFFHSLIRIGIYFFSFFSPLILIVILLLKFNLKIFKSNLFAIPTVTLGLLTMLVIFKIYFRIIEKTHAESICVREVLYVLFELDKEDSLTRLDSKALLAYRIEYLSKVSLILGTRINSKYSNWVDDHFKNIYEYIQERRRWIVSPTKNTLNDLRRDFIFLANIYTSGQYGEFKWEKSSLETKKSQEDNKLSSLKLLARFLGITLPLLIMFLYIQNPKNSLFLGFNINKDAVTYTFLAWLLISIDTTLKLGIVESLTKLAQGLRELGK